MALKPNNMKTILFLLQAFLLLSCHDPNSHEIRDFSKPHTFTLKTEKGHHYTSYSVRLEGFVDDSIAVSMYALPTPQKFGGVIDTLIILDFYGGYDQLDLTVDPYKAKSGQLKVSHSAD